MQGNEERLEGSRETRGDEESLMKERRREEPGEERGEVREIASERRGKRVKSKKHNICHNLAL